MNDEELRGSCLRMCMAFKKWASAPGWENDQYDELFESIRAIGDQVGIDVQEETPDDPF